MNAHMKGSNGKVEVYVDLRGSNVIVTIVFEKTSEAQKAVLGIDEAIETGGVRLTICEGDGLLVEGMEA